MINIEDFNFKNLSDLDFAELSACECGDPNCTPTIIADDECSISDIIVDFSSQQNCPKVAGAAIFLDNTASLYLPSDIFNDNEEANDENSSNQNDNVFRMTVLKTSKDRLIKSFSEVVEEEDLHHLIIVEEISKNEFAVISPNSDDNHNICINHDNEIDFDNIMSTIDDIFNDADENNLNIQDYFLTSLRENNEVLFSQVDYLLNLSAFFDDDKCVSILLILLVYLKNNDISKDQFLDYLLNGPKDIIDGIRSMIK